MPETWVDELTKLREKVAFPLFADANPRMVAADAKTVGNASTHSRHELKQKQKKSRKEADEEGGFSYKETCILSDSTICLLLDRFVPS